MNNTRKTPTQRLHGPALALTPTRDEHTHLLDSSQARRPPVPVQDQGRFHGSPYVGPGLLRILVLREHRSRYQFQQPTGRAVFGTTACFTVCDDVSGWVGGIIPGVGAVIHRLASRAVARSRRRAGRQIGDRCCFCSTALHFFCRMQIRGRFLFVPGPYHPLYELSAGGTSNRHRRGLGFELAEFMFEC